MTRSHWLAALVVMTAMMQVAILYRQPHQATPQSATADAPENTFIDLTGFPARGRPDARAVVMEFSDYECPFCARHATTVLPQLIRQFVDDGTVRYVIANNPLPIHPDARWLARMAMCAGAQGKYWEMHDRLFLAPQNNEEAVLAFAPELQLDSLALRTCVDSLNPEQDRVLTRDQALAHRLGLVGTPAFAVGVVADMNRVHLLKVIHGAQPLDVFTSVINGVIQLSAGNKT